jgi:ubiquinone/menaquinone biosynthesis C-methylase UbiE
VAGDPERTRQLGLSDIRNPLFARMYVRVCERSAKRDKNRARLFADLHGRVLELGCGSGVNFMRYRPPVTEVIAVEPEPTLRERAERAAEDAPVRVAVVAGQADDLPLDDESVDEAVSSLVLCSVPDQAVALAELRRVLRPGGRLHFYEHVVARNPVGRALERAADATLWPRIFGNCHLARDTQASIERAGFQIERCERLRLTESDFPHRHILGQARRPV